MSRRVRIAIAACVLTLMSFAAQALNYQFMHRSPISYFTQEDLAIANAKALEILDAGADGETSEWRNDASGNHGSYTIRKTFQKDGQPCRTVTVHDVGGPAEMTTTHTACKDTDGEWKILK